MAWVRIDKSWHDTTVENCGVCGNLLIRQAWVFTGPDGEEIRACREDDERLLRVLREHATQVEEARARWAANTPVTGTPEATA